jgi:hypothetical protein
MASQGRWHEARHQADVARSIDRQVANPFLFNELHHQIALTNSSRSPGISPAGLAREDAVAWLADMMMAASEWENLRALVDSQPHPELLNNHRIWSALSAERYIADDTEGMENARERAFEIDPSWPLDPLWPLPQSQVSPYLPLNIWDEIPFPSGDAVPVGTQRGGENDRELIMFSNSDVDMAVEIETAGWHRAVVFAHAHPSNGIWPIIQVSVPGVPPVAKYLNNQQERYYITPLLFRRGTNLLRISYVNDTERLAPNEDRNVILHAVWIEPTPMTTELP